jgi:V-type H+-transporting ATPase proteolipid subunit
MTIIIIYYYSGYMGASLCMILSSWGSAWGTWRAGLGICHMGIDHPAGIIKNIVPIGMAGVLGIYGLIVSVIITQAVVPPNQNDHTNTYSTFNGYTHVSYPRHTAGSIRNIYLVDSHNLMRAFLALCLIFLHATLRSWLLVCVVVYPAWRPVEQSVFWAEMGGTGGGRNSVDGANKLYVGMLIMLIFSEALALYGLIVALILSQHNYICN